MAVSSLTADLRRRRCRAYASVLLTYWLSSTPVMAYDSVDAAGISQTSQPAYSQNASPAAAPKYSARGILLSENSRGILTDSPYLARRLNDAGGGGTHYKSEPRRHPANLPPVPRFNKPNTTSLFSIHSASPVAPVTATPTESSPVAQKAAAPQKATPQKKAVAKAKISEPVPASRVITRKATDAQLEQAAEQRRQKTEAEKLAAELKQKAQEQANTPDAAPVAPSAPKAKAVAAARPKPAPQPRMPMPAATTIESGLALKNIPKQPEIIPLPESPLPPRDVLSPVSQEDAKTAATPFSEPDAPQAVMAPEPAMKSAPKPAPEVAQKILKNEVIKTQPVISKGDIAATKKVAPQPVLAKKPDEVKPKHVLPVLAKKPDENKAQHVLRAPNSSITTADRVIRGADTSIAAEEEAKSILRMSSGGDVTDIKVSPLKSPEILPETSAIKQDGAQAVKQEVIMQKLPAKSSPVLIPQVPMNAAAQKSTPNTLVPKTASSAQSGAPAQAMPIRTKKEVASEIESKLQEALAARGKLAQEAQHHTSPSLSAQNLPPEMANKPEENPSALANKPVTPKAVAKIQAAIQALRKANADHAAGVGQKHEKELQAVEAEKARAEAEAAKLKRELAEKERLAAQAKKNTSQTLRLPAAMQQNSAASTSQPAKEAVTIMKMPAIAEAAPAKQTSDEDMSQGEMALLGAAKDKSAGEEAQDSAKTAPIAEEKKGNAATFSLMQELEQSMGSDDKELAPLPTPEPLVPIKPQSSMKLPFRSAEQEEAMRLSALAPAAGPVLPSNSPLWLSKEAQQRESAAALERADVAAITPVYTSTPVITARTTTDGIEENRIETLAMPLRQEAKTAPSEAEAALLFQAGYSSSDTEKTQEDSPQQSPATPVAKPLALKPEDALVQEAIPASPQGLLVTIQADQPLKPKETQIASISDDVPESAVVPMTEKKVERMIGGGQPVALLTPPAPLPASAQPAEKGKVIGVTAASTPIRAKGDQITHMITPDMLVKKVPLSPSTPQDSFEPQVVPVPRPYEESAAHQDTLSMESKDALSRLPSGLGAPIPLPEPEKPARMTNPDQVQTHEAQGVSIEMRRPNFNIQKTMEDAYHALMENNIGTAMDRYQMVLEVQPYNNEAKFGLATIYHRMGELAMARDLYADVIKAEPQNLEALNNLLVLVSQESPQEALGELEQLELRNPDFSPIPAQLAAIHAKMGNLDQAINSIRRASQIEPDNLAYRYNLAVLLDKSGQREDALEIYVALKRAYDRGEDIPADIQAIQERLTFLLSNRG